jgi:ribose 5-phosphate isomerase B
MSANKVQGIRAALCQDTHSARMSGEHNGANVLCMGERVHGPGLAEEVVKPWLETEFSQEEHHGTRVAKIRALEGR